MGKSGEEFFFRPRPKPTHARLDLPPHRFDGIEIRRISRQIEQARPRRLNGLANTGNVVRGQVVDDGNVTFPKAGSKLLAHPCQKELPVHRAVEKTRGERPVKADRRNQRVGMVVAMRGVRQKPQASQRAAT